MGSNAGGAGRTGRAGAGTTPVAGVQALEAVGVRTRIVGVGPVNPNQRGWSVDMIAQGGQRLPGQTYSGTLNDALLRTRDIAVQGGYRGTAYASPMRMY